MEALIRTFFFFLISTLVFMIIDVAASKSEYAHGIVIDKHYKEANTRTSTGTVVNSKGGVGFVSTTSSEPEEFLIIAKLQNKAFATAVCEPELYYSKPKNARIRLRFEKGYFTGSVWGVYGVE